MWQEASRVIVVLTVVLATAAALSDGDVSVVPECGGSSGRIPSAVVDAQLAERNQKRHLKALFDRWAPPTLRMWSQLCCCKHAKSSAQELNVMTRHKGC